MGGGVAYTTRNIMTTQYYRWTEQQPPGVAIVSAVADVTGNDESTLPLLQQSVDVDALEQVIMESLSDVSVSFVYAGVRVTIDSGGSISVASHVD